MNATYAAGERGARAAAREGAAVVVVDAFRASTTISVLVSKGARVVPVASIEEAASYAGAYYRIGERGSAKVHGFDFGNSPTEIEATELKRVPRASSARRTAPESSRLLAALPPSWPGPSLTPTPSPTSLRAGPTGCASR